jgi:hypothetical protein
MSDLPAHALLMFLLPQCPTGWSTPIATVPSQMITADGGIADGLPHSSGVQTPAIWCEKDEAGRCAETVEDPIDGYRVKSEECH